MQQAVQWCDGTDVCMAAGIMLIEHFGGLRSVAIEVLLSQRLVPSKVAYLTGFRGRLIMCNRRCT
jgi:hypothetical protein